jgi:membrane-associated HD superfamily phosphohydrolase
MHVASITISIFLIVASLLAYHRTNSGKILYTTIGFSSLLIVELLFLLEVIPGTSSTMQRGIYVGLPHMLLLLMLTLFGLGVLKVEK